MPHNGKLNQLSMVAIHCVSSRLSNPILTNMVSGMDNNMPAGPSTQPQKINDANTMSVERPTRWPMNLGSMKLPIRILMTK